MFHSAYDVDSLVQVVLAHATDRVNIPSEPAKLLSQRGGRPAAAAHLKVFFRALLWPPAKTSRHAFVPLESHQAKENSPPISYLAGSF